MTGKQIQILKGLGLQIKKGLRAKFMTQKELAEKLETTDSHVSNIVNGNFDYGVTMLTRIVEILEIEINFKEL
jgi:predicted XRE-type DNA-binding protein